MILAFTGVGVLVGSALPWLIARIPDRPPAQGESPARTYRELAAVPGLWLPLGLAVALVWTLLGLARDDLGAALPAFLAVAAVGVAMAYVDLREHRLPDWLTFPAFAVAALALAVAAASEGEWSGYGRAWAGAGAAVAFYLILALLRPSDLGLGDVKLAAVIGLLLGWIGWSALIFGIFAGFVIGALVGVLLMTVGRAGRRTAIPFGPPMLAGLLVAAVWGPSIVDAYLAF